MKPIIGVMPLWDDDKESVWMLPGYLDGVQDGGGVPFVFPFSADENDLRRLANLCDGFLFTGGHDVAPAMYREAPLAGLVSCCEKRDRMESFVLRAAIDGDKPLLGICRGLQLVNAALGGTLYQDLPSQRPSAVTHRQRPPYSAPAHEVALAGGSPLRELLGVERLAVNSYHHQAVKALAPGLEAMAFSPDGLVEALRLPGHRFLWAVQWHPEYSRATDASSREIFRAFVRAAQ